MADPAYFQQFVLTDIETKKNSKLLFRICAFLTIGCKYLSLAVTDFLK